MAITLNPGAGGSVTATDLISSEHYQLVKLVHGAAGVNAGPVSTANGLPVRLLSETGRNNTNYFMAAAVLTTATDTLMSLTGYKSGAAVAAAASPAVVTTGKTYRITAISATYISNAAFGSARFTLRANTAGTAVIGSPAVFTFQVGQQGANNAGTVLAGSVFTYSIPIPEGLEFAAGTGIALSMVGLNATQVATAVGYGQVAIVGYEY